MQTLLNHDNQAATIEIETGYNAETQQVIKSRKTWDQLTDSNRQDVASRWIRDHVYCNVNQVMELLAQNEDHCDFDEYMTIAEYQDYDVVSADHINDLSIDDLIDLAGDRDIEIDNDFDRLQDQLLKDLQEKLSLLTCTIEVAYNELNITLLCDPKKDLEEYKNIDELALELQELFSDESLWTYDDLDTFCINSGINFDGYLGAFQRDLASLIISNIDLEQYGQDNDLDPEYQQSYEFWSVSDHFVSMLKDNEYCSNDILGLSVWARYCTGQSICLDHAIQVAAFKVLSDCSYDHY